MGTLPQGEITKMKYFKEMWNDCTLIGKVTLFPFIILAHIVCVPLLFIIVFPFLVLNKLFPRVWEKLDGGLDGVFLYIRRIFIKDKY